MMSSFARIDKSRSGGGCFFACGIVYLLITNPYFGSAYCRKGNLVECSDFLYNNKGIVVG
ncbi:Hypothetical protein TPAS_2338 [Trichococcus pasteurii]|uniref:Uncharacterized protein n=1 Tax=Trichococcus pasteurii TaxID=43064 RepID=A0A1W1II15_9LACT|nr:hypothetical protein SAMN04488086_10988 [Trichococcus pasteurii]SLM52644.1 Hypothetical protein TPAS_2338 [Trichococcus pasteurii]SSB93525.1 Hypothetical protein TPAS_2338 [Trichococcus pasteurii]